MSLKLRVFRLSGNWQPLLRRLDGWVETTPFDWTDGESEISFSAGPEIGFIGTRGEDEGTRVSPSGMRIGMGVHRCESVALTLPYIMNHISLNVPNIEQEVEWYESLLGPSTVIARSSSWDPFQGRDLPDAHLFIRPNFYITIRGNFEQPAVDHVGWMACSPHYVDLAAKILTEIGWYILVGPKVIDSSYLVHFRGPDGRIHDFFYPEESLDRRSS